MKKIAAIFLLINIFYFMIPANVSAYSFVFAGDETILIEGMTAQETTEYISNLTEDEAMKFEEDLINWIIDRTPRELGRQDEVIEDASDMTYREMGLSPDNLELPDKYAWTRPKSEFEQMTVEEQMNYMSGLGGFEPSERQTRRHALHKYLREEWRLYDTALFALELSVNKHQLGSYVKYLAEEKAPSHIGPIAKGYTAISILSDPLGFLIDYPFKSVTFTLYPTDDGSLFVLNDPMYSIRKFQEREYARLLPKHGTISWWDGNYTGELKDGGIPEGRGEWTRPDGAKYEGDFMDGSFHGYGELFYPNGHVYKGDFYEGFRHGWGSYIKPDGERYDGPWVNDKRNGWGTYIWADGAKYEGEMKDDMLHGQGKLTLPNGRVLSGRFEKNNFID